MARLSCEGVPTDEVPMLSLILLVLGAATIVYAAVLTRSAVAARMAAPSVEAVGVGAAVNFFDTLGIGSFAPTLAWLQLRTSLPARLIPCTMLVACGLPTILQAAIFLVLLGIHVDAGLIVAYSVALTLGGLVGARLVTRVRVWIVQAVVAAAMLIAASLYAATNLHLLPAGGAAAGLPPMLAAVAVAAALVMGILLNFGVGHYAPSLLMFSLMGMDPRLIFPIMATGGALTVLVVGGRHIVGRLADVRIAVAFALGGIPAVAVAAFIVHDLPVEDLRWLVIAVVVVAAAIMARDAARSFTAAGGDAAPTAA